MIARNLVTRASASNSDLPESRSGSARSIGRTYTAVFITRNRSLCPGGWLIKCCGVLCSKARSMRTLARECGFMNGQTEPSRRTCRALRSSRLLYVYYTSAGPRSDRLFLVAPRLGQHNTETRLRSSEKAREEENERARARTAPAFVTSALTKLSRTCCSTNMYPKSDERFLLSNQPALIFTVLLIVSTC